MKKIPAGGITGQKGIALVERTVLDMGSIWHATGGLEAGIDGFIEFRDPTTGEVLNRHVCVQSKATMKPFDAEAPSYTCAPNDLEYWMKGNMPIILVVSRPDSGEAYWVSVRDSFQDPARRGSRKVVFDKVRDRFDKSAFHRLQETATSKTRGTYLAPTPAREKIFSNLLRVGRLPARLFHAYTDCLRPKDVRERLNEAGGRDLHEWAYRGKQIISVYDLSSPLWGCVCDRGTVEAFDPREWADSVDEDRRNDFVDLLNQCLRSRLRRLHVRFDKNDDHYHFTATHDLSERFVSYRSLVRDSGRPVFKRYQMKVGATVLTYCRHHGFYGRFRRYDEEWFLQIDPTYRFTTDGRSVHPNASKLLSGIRKLEKNPTVLGQVVMWASLLQDPDSQDIFAVAPYPHLGFGDLVMAESHVGIDDDEWLSSDDNPAAHLAKDQANEDELDLFLEPTFEDTTA